LAAYIAPLTCSITATMWLLIGMSRARSRYMPCHHFARVSCAPPTRLSGKWEILPCAPPPPPPPPHVYPPSDDHHLRGAAALMATFKNPCTPCLSHCCSPHSPDVIMVAAACRSSPGSPGCTKCKQASVVTWASSKGQQHGRAIPRKHFSDAQHTDVTPMNLQ
jgi:hypothetical protein